MNEMVAGNQPAQHPLAELLREKRINRIMIIDDDYDLPTRNKFEENELAEFWSALDINSPEQREALSQLLGSMPKSEDDISDIGVAKLYEHRHKLGPLQEAFDTHLRTSLEKGYADLERFVGRLRNDLGLEVATYGTQESADGKADIIFLDYYLGPRSDKTSVNAARDTIRKLLGAYESGAEKPIVVLMSSEANLKEESESFREQMGIVGGMFYFIWKDDLSDRGKMFLNLDMLASAIPAGHHVQKFIDAVEDMADSIKNDFLSAIKRLNLDDYVYIQRLSLQADGHPLGDYLLWLYSAYFGHLLFERALGEKRRELDKLTFADWLPSHAMPSKQLTAMYHAALFDTTVGPLTKHPRWIPKPIEPTQVANQLDNTLTDAVIHSAEPDDLVETLTRSMSGISFSAGDNVRDLEQVNAPTAAISGVAESLLNNGSQDKKDELETNTHKNNETKEVGSLPYFNLGDVFLNSSLTQLFMVSNPACDLEFTPDIKQRSPDPEDSIIFIPGTLELLRNIQVSKEKYLRTELFEYEGERYRVRWKPKRVKTITHKEAEEWLQINHLTRVARLRIPFSLEIQHHFAASLTRVGVPTAPPFYRPLRVTLYEKGNDGSHTVVPITDSDAEAFVITTKDSDKCVLTKGLVLTLLRHIDKIAAQDVPLIDKTTLNKADIARQDRVQKRIKKAQSSQSNFLAWREVSTPFTLPASGKCYVFSNAGIEVGRDTATDGQWSSEHLLIVHVSEENSPTM